MDDLRTTLRLEGEAVKSGNLRDYRTLGALMISAAARIEELALKLLAAEGQAADNLERAEALRKENERLREAVEAQTAGKE